MARSVAMMIMVRMNELRLSKNVSESGGVPIRENSYSMPGNNNGNYEHKSYGATADTGAFTLLVSISNFFILAYYMQILL
jgi:hypothetical protein